MDSFKAIAKRFLSYSKSTWDFDDYPISTWKNPNAGGANVDYGAGIINWFTMVGHGETTEKAIEALKEQFKKYKDYNDKLPRPGTKVPFKYASTEQIDKYEDIAVDFFERVLGMDYSNGFYSDGSILAYFEPYDDEEEAKKMREEIIMRTILHYDVDITDAYDDPLYKILEKIKQNNKK